MTEVDLHTAKPACGPPLILLSATAVLLLASATAEAATIRYEIVFGPNEITTDSGVGTFSWDAETQLIRNFAWDFGSGRTGHIDDSIFNWSSPAHAGTFAQIAFEVLTLQACIPPIVRCLAVVSA